MARLFSLLDRTLGMRMVMNVAGGRTLCVKLGIMSLDKPRRWSAWALIACMAVVAWGCGRTSLDTADDAGVDDGTADAAS